MKFTLFFLLLSNLALSTAMAVSPSSDMELITVSSKKLEKSLVNPKTDAVESVSLEDYDPIDLVPSSKASIRHSPIEHGLPLNPFIPKPPPPAHPKR